jgi:hypothetical protein
MGGCKFEATGHGQSELKTPRKWLLVHNLGKMVRGLLGVVRPGNSSFNYVVIVLCCTPVQKSLYLSATLLSSLK